MAQQYQTKIPKIEPTYRKFNVAIGRCSCCKRRVRGRTQAGTEAQGILMSVLRTAAQQCKNASDFLAETLRAPPQLAPRLIATTT